jgi:2-keto-3-deoxy-L-rhamnonate aldolase RhmA
MGNRFNYIAITNDVDQALIISRSGVQQIMVDTEIIGKVERQNGKQTVINTHSLSDILRLKNTLPDTIEIICRVNPFNAGIEREIKTAVEYGANAVMIPMIVNLADYRKCVNFVPKDVKIVPLIETPYSVFKIEEILDCRFPDQIHFGLNDLFIALHMNNLFEVLFSQIFQIVVKGASEKVNIVGVGGVGTPDISQKVNPLLLIKEYCAMGSNSVILSRSFFHDGYDVQKISSGIQKIETAATEPYTMDQQRLLKEQVKRFII